MPALAKGELQQAEADHKALSTCLRTTLTAAFASLREKQDVGDAVAVADLEGLIARIEEVQGRLSRRLLRKIGDSAGVQEAISAFKGAAKTLNDAVDAGLAEAAERQKVAGILADLTKLANSLQTIADTAD
ncbi:MAG: hypothetical protein H6843_07830 [Rhodospirillaceae bacterium]|nr:hypothetical protein [Rhodospirillaceae bacterium]